MAHDLDIEFGIEYDDIRKFDCDIIAMKYAQAFHGADREISYILSNVGIPIDVMQPTIGNHVIVRTLNSIPAEHVLFVGVLPLENFGYRQIREFSTNVLDILSRSDRNYRHIAMTLHGAGYGLDEVESILAEFGGIRDAMVTMRIPAALQRISIVDFNHDRVERLRLALEQSLENETYAFKLDSNRWTYKISLPSKPEHTVRVSDPGIYSLEAAGKEPKPNIFVAMPFRKEISDVFTIAINEAAHKAGFLAERVDMETFTGDILEQVKKRIETAELVIADMTGANPNVYLEVGYAWGMKRPTILLVKEGEELLFDVRGQRCLTYDTIYKLREQLTIDLNNIKSQLKSY